jgi:hypothetical protein
VLLLLLLLLAFEGATDIPWTGRLGVGLLFFTSFTRAA